MDSRNDMKQSTITTLLILGAILAFSSGCGNNEKPADSSEAGKATSAPQTQSTDLATQPALQASNGASVTPAAVKLAQPAAPPVQATAEPVGVTNAVLDQTPAQTPVTLAALSNDQVVQGLEEALGKGLQQAIARLGHDGGFLTNVTARIPMPEKLQKVETTLRAMKQDKLADDFIATMNHAAEQAVPEAGVVFADALKRLSIQDAKAILAGPNDAATQYFQKATQTNLYSKFYPIVQKATGRTGVTAAYKNVMEKVGASKSLGAFGNKLSGALFDKDSLDLDAYVTNKAMDGLFKMVAEEEKQIRQNPVARTTATLQKVFGALSRQL